MSFLESSSPPIVFSQATSDETTHVGVVRGGGQGQSGSSQAVVQGSGSPEGCFAAILIRLPLVSHLLPTLDDAHPSRYYHHLLARTLALPLSPTLCYVDDWRRTHLVGCMIACIFACFIIVTSRRVLCISTRT